MIVIDTKNLNFMKIIITMTFLKIKKFDQILNLKKKF